MSEVNSVLESMDIASVMRLLPHRYPFLLIDRIIEIDGDDSAIGIKNVTLNEPHFQGHFPEKPVMPGVLIVEAIAQTAGAICMANLTDTNASDVYLLGIDKARFRHPVVPGDVLELHVRKLRHRGTIWKYLGTAIVDGQKVAEAEVSAMLAPDAG